MRGAGGGAAGEQEGNMSGVPGGEGAQYCWSGLSPTGQRHVHGVADARLPRGPHARDDVAHLGDGAKQGRQAGSHQPQPQPQPQQQPQQQPPH